MWIFKKNGALKNSHDVSIVLGQIRNDFQPALVADETAISAEIENNDHHRTGIILKILSIAGGVLASIAFIGFLALANLFESETAIAVLGFLSFAASLFLISIVDKLFVTTVIVSFYIMGYVLVGAGLGFQNVDTVIICILFIILALVSLLFTQNWIFAFISVLVINGSLIGMILSGSYYNNINLYVPFAVIVFLLITLNEASIVTAHKKFSKLYEPFRLGTLISLLGGLALTGVRDLITLDYRLVSVSGAISIAAMLFLVMRLFKVLEIETRSTKVLIICLGVLILLPTIMSPAIPGSLLIILACFYVNYKPGLIIGIVSLVFFISRYYYDLNLTLLTKSLILMASGAIFLLCYFVTVKKLVHHEEV
ncbi:MAG: DUF4401 domain-containing protein [Chitinophagaceae bacterium]|nr:MAG: DUF4401 domain-containing protein [Chitinophagaceae bacterium]